MRIIIIIFLLIIVYAHACGIFQPGLQTPMETIQVTNQSKVKAKVVYIIDNV